MKRWVITAIVMVAVIVCAGALWSLFTTSQDVLRLHGHTHEVTVLRTEEELTRGLSGTDNLPKDHAMLFVFGADDKWGIWMKDMKYPIDIVWLDSGRKVVHLVKNAKPSSYPDTIFKPHQNSRYVIELPSGTIERTGIVVGDTAELPSGV